MASIVSNTFLFSFKGRINRAKYWYALLASTIFCLVVLVMLADAIEHIFGVDVEGIDLDFQDIFRHFPSLPFHISFDNTGSTSVAALWFYAAGTPVVVFGIWFLTATTVKRLHDRDKSAWWIVPFEIAPPVLHRLGDGLHHSHLAFFRQLARGNPQRVGLHRAVVAERSESAEPVRTRPAGADRCTPGMGSDQRNGIRAA